MNEFEFADKHLHPYKVKNKEILPMYCPQCGGGKHRDKYTFALNVDKHTFNCLRGSCGAKGTFNELCKEYGERAEYMSEYRKNNFDRVVEKKEYKKPSMKLTGIAKVAAEYIEKRNISLKTAMYFGVKSDDKGNIVFPYYDENGDHVLNKIRIPRAFVKGGKDKTKIWQEGEGKPVLMGMNLADVNTPLVITEGEWDCLAVYESGYKNVVSIPFGTNNMDWINECWDWLHEVKEIILWFDSDLAGRKAVEEVSRKLGVYKCKIVNCKDKDANVTLYIHGVEKVLEHINNAAYVPIQNLSRLSDCKMKTTERILFGNKFLDYWLGGCRMGELTIWTGKRGSGKSTVLNQTLMDTVDQQVKCFLYTGELANGKAKQWLDRQIAGEKYIVSFKDELTGREEFGVHPKITPIIEDWYKDYLFCYGDDGEDNIEDIIEVMEYAYRRYNVKRFVLDNLKTIIQNGEKDFYRGQANIIKALIKFVKNYNVHIDLVVHPRKTKNEELADEDVGGSSDIIDLAHNIIEVRRIYDDEKKKDGVKDEIKNNDTVLKIKKNREYGDVDKEGYFKFNPKSKRLYGNYNFKVYSWEKNINGKDHVIETKFELVEEKAPWDM